MKYFIVEATHLRSQLAFWIQELEPPYSAFLEAGQNGLCDLQVEGITREKSTFADCIVDSRYKFPKELMQALCLGVAYIESALEEYENGHEAALTYMTKAAEEVGFYRGAYFGVGHVFAQRRVALSASGKKGALSRHGPSDELKAWALSQAKGNHGAHQDIARQMVTQIPTHLADVSKDPERLIYETLRAQLKPN
jgi:hypothetical protein